MNERNSELIEKRKLHKATNGEKEVARFLRANHIKFIREYHNTTLVNKYGSLLFMDFYLPVLKIAIEFDGPGHFAPVFGKEQLLKTRYHDRVKNRWCKIHKIKMIRVSEWRRADIVKHLIKALI